MWSFVVKIVLLSAFVAQCTAVGRLREEFIWGHRDDRTDRVCHSQSVVIEPTLEAFFNFFRPVTRLVSFIPPTPDQTVRYIRPWTDAPWHRFRADLVHGGVGTKAPATTAIQLSRHWMLFVNVVIYCSKPET
ncbi:uncharacterized protein LOC131284296 [Anopheles ziemanni]|uniref:uncharacterized protein LOC131272383 n=1 Tax=Anopheles coustani TaxID=139045 RepID=UPI00265B3F4A|nr:uncharacterized protein LOC131272383 [Anopheles coustani]XP_058169134.1 uncharacterized protein LOC131284296 [Anopheles ziemanni]